MTSPKSTIRNFVEQTYLNGESGFADDEDLFETGVLDSLAFLNLVRFLEQEFALRFDGGDLDIDRFRTLDAITEMVSTVGKGA